SVTARLARALGVEATLLPATDARLRTWVETPAGELSFQEWFVRRQHRDEVDGVRFEGAEEARAAPGVVAALEAADLIAIAPSNPFVSIAPILAVAEIRQALERRRVPAVAVSPLIGGRTGWATGCTSAPATRSAARSGRSSWASGAAATTRSCAAPISSCSRPGRARRSTRPATSWTRSARRRSSASPATSPSPTQACC